MMNKKGYAPLILIILIGVGIFLISTGFSLRQLQLGSITGSGYYIERPVFKYVKCEPFSSLKYSMNYQLANEGEWLYKPSVASSYNVKINSPKINTGGKTRILYSVCNSQINSASNCRIYQAFQEGIGGAIINVDLTEIRNEETVYAVFQLVSITTLFKWKNYGGVTYQIGFVPYGLRTYDVLSGSSAPLNENDCTIPSSDESWKDRFLGSDSKKVNSQISKNVNKQTLQPEEVRWYVAGYVTSAAPSFMLTYQGQSAWCRSTGTSGEIYKINIIQVGSGTYKIASPDWSDFLGSVTCCPKEIRGSDVCQSDFTWKSIEKSECGAFQSCGSPNWVPYSTNQIIKYSCVSGKCVKEIKDVECANDYDCKDANMLCNLNTWKCVRANVNLDGQVIKTIPDNIADCQAQGGIWRKTTETKKTGALCILGYGLCKDNVIINEYCDMEGSKIKWYTWFIIVIVIILALILLIRMWPIIYGWIKMIPIIGRVLP